MQPIPEYKIVTIGDSGVGKTCIINRFYFGSFNETAAATVGAAYVKSRVEVDGKPVYLNLWDTAGQEKYANLLPMYVRESNAVIICYDASQSCSIEKLQQYRDMLAGIVAPDVPVIICGNKIDLLEEPGSNDVMIWAASQNLDAFEVSAKTGQGIEELFADVAKKAHDSSATVNKANELSKKKREREDNPSSCC